MQETDQPTDGRAASPRARVAQGRPGLKALTTVLALAALAGAPSGWGATKPLRIDSLSPATAGHGELVTMHGSGFAKTIQVTVGGVTAELLSAKGSKASFRVPALAPVGVVPVEVRKPGGRRASAELSVRFDGRTVAVADDASAVALVVGAEGGAVGVHGMTLAIPAGAVPEGTVITATPLVAIAGSPFSGAPVGLKLEPSGLVLLQPATLSLPRPSGDGFVVGFGFDGDGDSFHLVPHRAVGDTLQLKVWHFSGAGVLPARLAELATALSYEPSPAHMLAEQRIAAALLDAELNGSDPGPAIAAALRDWRLRSVLTGLDVARTTTEIAFFELAFGEWLAWNAYLQEYRDSLGPADTSFFDSVVPLDRDIATVSAAAVARRALDRCTGPTLPASALRDVLRIAGPVNLAELPIDDVADPGERPLPDGRSLPTGCVDVQIGAVDHAPVLARNRDNGFVAGAQVVFWDGPPSTSIPLRYRLGDSTDGPPVPLASETTDGGFSTTIRPATLGLRTLELTVDLGPDDVLRAFFDRRVLTVPVRERLELHARRAGDPSFTDTIGPVAPGGTVELRIRLAGDASAGATVALAHDGGGTLPASATTNAAGEAVVSYLAPAVEALETVSASVVDAGIESRDTLEIRTESPVTVAVSPTTATVAPGATRRFTATVTGTADTRVTWSATGGTIDATGLFTGPSSAGTFTVTATSVADPASSSSATVHVVAAPLATYSLGQRSFRVGTSAGAGAHSGLEHDCVSNFDSDRHLLELPADEDDPGLALFSFAGSSAAGASASAPGGGFGSGSASSSLDAQISEAAGGFSLAAAGSAGAVTIANMDLYDCGGSSGFRGNGSGDAFFGGHLDFTVDTGTFAYGISGSGSGGSGNGDGYVEVRLDNFLTGQRLVFHRIPSSAATIDLAGVVGPGTYRLSVAGACTAEFNTFCASDLGAVVAFAPTS